VLGGAAPPSLERRLGPWDAAAIVVSNVIGVGIFITPGFIATLLPNSMAILGVWALGGALALFGALAYAELAARQPEAGGEYVYLREAFGAWPRFSGWTSFVAGFSGRDRRGRRRHRRVSRPADSGRRQRRADFLAAHRSAVDHALPPCHRRHRRHHGAGPRSDARPSPSDACCRIR
jgi:hypothetical protein